MAEFKIGRLRVTWGGPWTTSTTYNRDTVVQFNGKTYNCLIPHTAGNFTTDLASAYWGLQIDGKSFKGPWQASTSYVPGNLVTYGGTVYACITAHTSATVLDLTKFVTYVQTNKWNSNWQTNYNYGVGDTVKYGGIVYTCNTQHTSSATTVLGLEANQSSWTILYSGIEYRGDWVIGLRYKLRDIVKQGAELFICTTYNSDLTFTPANWTLYLAGQELAGSWLIGTTYQQGDIVLYGGYSYVSNISNNTGNNPFSDAVSWSIITSGFTISGEWNPLTSYPLGAIVTRNGYSYSATQNSVAKDPSTGYISAIYKSTGSSGTTVKVVTTAGIAAGMFVIGTGFNYGQYVSAVVDSTTLTLNIPPNATLADNQSLNFVGVDSSLWQLLVPGAAFKGAWVTSTTYLTGDTVIYKNTTYYAIKVHSGVQPDTDTTNSNWVTYINHFRKNASGALGDITYYNSATAPTYSALSIGSTSYVLRVNSNQPSWAYINSVPNVYYVAPNGLDVSGAASPSSYTVGNNGSSSYSINGASNPTLQFIRGQTYTFNMSTPGHPFWIQSASGSYNVANIYSTGVTNNGATSGTIIFTVPYNAPSTLYYVCQYHPSMAGSISIISTDPSKYGTTWDQPWATVRYACDKIGAGLVYTTAGAQLLANREFLVQEMYYWMLTQKASQNPPFNSASVFDQTKTLRDARFIVDAVAYDIARGGNSQIVASTLLYFSSTNSFINTTVAAEMPYFVAGLTQLLTFIGSVLSGSQVLSPTYQTTNFVANPATYSYTNSYTFNSAATTAATTLMNILISALTNQTTAQVPQPNSGLTATIMVKTGTYNETLPITIPENVALNGDELRGVTIQPAGVINTIVTATDASTRLITAGSTANMIDGAPVQFIASVNAALVATTLGGLTTGQTYYIVGPSVTSTQFGITSIVSKFTNVVVSNTYIANAGASGATFNVTETATGYILSIATGGSNYTVNDSVKILGTSIGGATPTNDITILVTSVNSGTINGYTFTGSVASATVNVTVLNGIASNATFYVTRNGSGFTLTLSTPGTNYTNGDVIKILGSAIGGTTPENDITITVVSTAAGNIATFTSTGSSLAKLTTTIGSNLIYGGGALKDMFYMRNGSGLRNMTLSGLLGTLSAPDAYLLARPTGPAYTSLDPGTGPNDTSAWIFRKSPYVQNVTTFGTGCVGLKIDGTLHAGGNKSIVSNDFTQVLSDGIGIWCTGPGALTEAVSVFSYYNYAGYLAEAGGKIRATNGNSSYGTLGTVAVGYDVTETPIAGNIYNQSTQVQASVQSTLTGTATLLKLIYANAGSNYVQPTTNMLRYSNAFSTSPWTTDGNITLLKNGTALTGLTEAWLLTGTVSTAGSGYVYQNVTVNPAGGSYTSLSGTNISGTGTSATFNVVVTSTGYTVSVNAAGTGYAVGNQITINGSAVAGITGTNDITITVDTVSGGGTGPIATVTATGSVPTGSNQSYTLSLYVYQGTATNVDLYGIFSGSSTVTSTLNYNFISNTVTVGSSGGGVLPTNYGAQKTLVNGWYRIWMAINDTTGLNNALQWRFYPKGAAAGSTGNYTLVYGAQVEVSSTGGALSLAPYTPSFYLESQNDRYTAYAYFEINGAGAGAVVVADEQRSLSMFQARITDPGSGVGGLGYLTASSFAQVGTSTSLTLSLVDVNTANTYKGMRVFITSGTGAGQYGYINNYNSTTKVAQVLKDSFDELTVTGVATAGNTFSFIGGSDLSSLYANQPVTFVAKTYSTSISATNWATTTATATIGGTTNTLTVGSTASLLANMAITFTGTGFGNVTPGYTYYISAVVNSTTIQLAAQLFGATLQLTTGSGSLTLNYSAYNYYIYGSSTASMAPGLPVQFTGTAAGGITTATVYYINDIIDSNNFTISTSQQSVTASATAIGGNVTVGSTASLIALNPIVFTGLSFGNINVNQKYYISSIVDGVTIKLSSSITSLSVTASASSSNTFTTSSTSGFIVGNPIKFSGTMFGNVVLENTYFIQAIYSATQFRISSTSGGAFLNNISDGSGLMYIRTCTSTLPLTNAAGTLVGLSTGIKTVLGISYADSLTATWSTQLFAGVTAGTIYYIGTVNAGAGTTTLLSSPSGSTVAISTTTTGTMNMAAVGWDHINPGSPIVNLATDSVYFIEPKVTFTSPSFTQTNTAVVQSAGAGNSWKSIAYGKNFFIAIPNTGTSAAFSLTGTAWGSLTLPNSASWTSIAYGNGYWVVIATGTTQVIYSNNNGATWKSSTMPSSTTWNSVTYGNGIFVAVSNTTAVAYSTDFGKTWTGTTQTVSASPVTVVYGGGKFLSYVGSGNTNTSPDGATWTAATTIDTNTTNLTYGNGRFVAVTNSNTTTQYSFDGVTWITGNNNISASLVVYGQGIFVAIGNSGTAYISDSGQTWKSITISTATYACVAFGYDTTTVGVFTTLIGQNGGNYINAGVTARGRATITSGTMTGITLWENGSNYASTPTVTVVDPNVTINAAITPRIGNGALGNPTFINRGAGFATTSTKVIVTGNGYADQYQTGYDIIMNNLTGLPTAGCDLVITGDSTIYKVTGAYAVYNTVAPYIQAVVSVNPNITTLLSQPNNAVVSIRTKYSQVRLTNHDFLNIGYGNFITSNYPGIPTAGYSAVANNQAVEANFGRVFYTASDQDGNFKVGNLFGVQQATGIVTLSTSQFGLSGLSTLSLGGISVGGSSVSITQFSTDPTFIANSDGIIPTQRAVKTYLTSRLTAGSSNTVTTNFSAGTVVLGSPNLIGTTVPGTRNNVNVKVNITGSVAGVDGNFTAMQYFSRHFNHRTSTF